MPEISISLVDVFLFISLYFEIFLLVSFIERFGELKKAPSEPKEYPSVTIVVPCWNEAKTLAKTVDSLLGLEYPKEKLSIFLVDDGSTDNTWSEMQRFQNVPGISLFQKENGGKHSVLNMAIARATSDIIGCLDADSTVDAQALKRIVRRFENKNIQAVTAAIFVHNPKNIIERIQSVEYTLSAFIRKTFSYLGAIYITPGPFSFFRRGVFAKIGPYRKAHHTEDLEIALRMQLSGLAIDNAHDAYVYTIAPKTVRRLFKQRVRWIHGFLENMRDYKHLYFKKELGHVSMFILPMATLSIFTSLFFTGFSLFNGVSYALQKLTEFKTVGLSLALKPPTFSWFYIPTQTTFTLGLLLIALTVTLIFIGMYIQEKRVTIKRDLFYFIAFYSFLAPFWLAKSVYNTALSKKTSWR